MTLRRRAVAAVRFGLVLAFLPVVALLLSASPAASTPAAAKCGAKPVVSTHGTSVTAKETVCRRFFDKGVVDHRSFSVTVSNTKALRNNQVISVSWSGAHPSGAIQSAQQFQAAATQEYPVVLLECRGVDSTHVPVADRLSQSTCWTATPSERVIATPAPYGMWTLDANNAKDGICTDKYCNVPLPVPTNCTGKVSPGPQYWLPFVGAGGHDYPIGPGGCDGSPPEMLVGGESPDVIPSDTTYADTELNGTGSDKFTVMTSDTNASLGCSQTVPCSLVVIPIEGINCDANPAVGSPSYECESEGTFPPGSLNTGSNPYPPAQAVTGTYWWSGSNWDRRISIPLNFATPANACAQNTKAPLEFSGSELMTQAAQQWNPAFCLNKKLFNVDLVNMPEPVAKNSLRQGFIQSAVQGEPPPVPAGQKSYFTTPTVQAPLAVSGFAITYVVDNGNGTPYTQLKLDPRLLAKLLTESYSGSPNVQDDWQTTGEPPGTGPGECPANCNRAYAALAHNPESIFADPEFLALNPGYHPPNGIQPGPAATLFSLLSQSDVMWALTSYINSDPEARAWLNGKPDPWGMAVNPAYKGIQLPVESWPLLDRTTNGPDYTEQGNPFCLGALGNGAAKVPIRPLIDNPQETLAAVAYNMQYAIAASLISCNNNPLTPEYTELGPESLGTRFVLGLTTIPAAEEFDLDTAALQSYASPELETQSGQKFAAGRVFAAPTSSSLLAAANLMKPNTSLGSWTLSASDFPGDASAKGAYPGTMLLSADVPTKGLLKNEAVEYSEYLSFAATTGQAQGADVGQLPPGYVPIQGLADEVAYTKAAAADIRAQNGAVPPLVPGPPPPSTTTTTVVTNTTSPGSGTSGNGGSGLSGNSGQGGNGNGKNGNGNGKNGNGKNGNGKNGNGKNGNGGNSTTRTESLGKTIAVEAGVGGLALPLAVLLTLWGILWTLALALRRRKASK